MGNMELEELVKTCTWRSANTFTTHYLRNVSAFAEEVHSLDPLVAALCALSSEEEVVPKF